ncbi:MAG: permease [Sphaerochaeta sp.]|nr:permease [Sphaerochaeta sp.]
MMKIAKKFIGPSVVLVIYVALSFWRRDLAIQSSQVTWDYLKEMLLILPPVFLLMGLIETWIPKDKIQKWLGRGSGFKGIGISLVLGTLPTGPLYVAFPMAATLIRKGASHTNMVVFLGAWAALKIPQLMVEIKFLGIAFTLLRFVLTLVALVLMGLLIERILRKSPDLQWLQKTQGQAVPRSAGTMEQ